MMTTKDIKDYLATLPSTEVITNLITSDSKRATWRGVAGGVFSSINNMEDLDNPVTKGVFNVTPNTPITRPTKGAGWQYGYVINLAVGSGVQIWINFGGYIAVRGKGSSTADWSDWSVMQPL